MFIEIVKLNWEILHLERYLFSIHVEFKGVLLSESPQRNPSQNWAPGNRYKKKTTAKNTQFELRNCQAAVLENYRGRQ